MRAPRKGAEVTWRWGQGVARGKVVEVHARRVSREIKGETVVREGTAENPAVVVEQADGSTVLKLASELSGAD